MKGSIEEDVEAQILSPANELRLQKEEKEAFKHGLLFEKFPEILVNGHSTFTTTRIDKMKAMAVSWNYIFPPTKFNFRKVGRVTASILAFLRKIGFEKKSERKFRMFSVKRWRVSVIWSCQSSEKKSWMIILPRKFRDC